MAAQLEQMQPHRRPAAVSWCGDYDEKTHFLHTAVAAVTTGAFVDPVPRSRPGTISH